MDAAMTAVAVTATRRLLSLDPIIRTPGLVLYPCRGRAETRWKRV
jgi:hypothetical protein